VVGRNYCKPSRNTTTRGDDRTSADALADSAALRDAFWEEAAVRFADGMGRAAAALPNAARWFPPK